ncbi:hypothetical protein G8V05_04655 [Clostridium botulinum C/D]|uniref:hypothetical protein n=2 Tax=Clostridium botulinum TaxID=1491 RepID=UPI000166BE8F|nr:hypothetical protein [Clostridium botulinum]EDS76601.1 hypothetical protein CBC_A1795 [Clostridium botulinum C str. Eklund]KEH96470.1 hypothetical protein Z953_p0044 [Clostridium botulinum D str. 16868]MCD3277979.1 hypothetical protein [Clostridium botulinum C/D]MCD3281506.1 hypothetical protein [Clostridium botulinum C/D]
MINIKIKKDMEIIKKYIQKVCNREENDKFIVLDHKIICCDNSKYEGRFFYPKIIIFKNDITYEKDKRRKMTTCYMINDKEETISFTDWINQEYGGVRISYTIGEKDLQFDCLTFDNYDIYRYY